jgi:hypothetical protein
LTVGADQNGIGPRSIHSDHRVIMMAASKFASCALLAILTSGLLACGGRKTRPVEAAAPTKCEVGKRLAADGKTCEPVPATAVGGSGTGQRVGGGSGSGSGNNANGGVSGTGSGSATGLAGGTGSGSVPSGTGSGSVPSGGLGSGGGSVPSGGLGSGGGSGPSGGLGTGSGGLLGALGGLLGTGNRTGTGSGGSLGTGSGSKTGTGSGNKTGSGSGSGGGTGSGTLTGTKPGTGSGSSVAPSGGPVYAHLISTPNGDATTVSFASDSAGSKLLSDVTYRVIQDVTLNTREVTSTGYRISIDKLNVEARRSGGSSVFCTGVSYTGWVQCGASKEVAP